MDERLLQFRVGLMVVASLLITAILVVLFGEMPTFMQHTYAVTLRFPQAPGVTKDTPIRKSGILIGRVTDVRFAEDGGVLVLASIKRDVPLRRGEAVRIGGSLLGDADIQFVPSYQSKTAREVVQPGDVIEGEAPVAPMDLMAGAQRDFALMQQNISRTMQVAADTGDQMKRVAVQVGDLLDANERRVAEVLEEADKTLETVRLVTEDIQKITGDPQLQENLRKSVAEIPGLLQDTRQTVQGLGEAIELAKANLSNIERITTPLGEQAGPFIARLDTSATKLDTLINELTTFSQKLNSQDSTLGQLVHDRELYDNLNETVANIRDITVQAKPIVNDVRVFTDKIARHPETLGVRGAMQRNAGIK